MCVDAFLLRVAIPLSETAEQKLERRTSELMAKAEIRNNEKMAEARALGISGERLEEYKRRLDSQELEFTLEVSIPHAACIISAPTSSLSIQNHPLLIHLHDLCMI